MTFGVIGEFAGKWVQRELASVAAALHPLGHQAASARFALSDLIEDFAEDHAGVMRGEWTGVLTQSGSAWRARMASSLQWVSVAGTARR